MFSAEFLALLRDMNSDASLRSVLGRIGCVRFSFLCKLEIINCDLNSVTLFIFKFILPNWNSKFSVCLFFAFIVYHTFLAKNYG